MAENVKGIRNLWTTVFVKVPENLAGAFYADCAQKNNFRFSILPIFNIITQISCYFIYLYIYPATFPDLPRLDPVFFTIFSVVYVVVNIVFCILFNQMRRKKDPHLAKRSHALTIAFLAFYILFESIETIMEVEISGNIYRFLATFFMVTLLPSLPRRERFGSLIVFTVLVEIGFAIITAQGYSSNNRFQDIVVLFCLVCLVLSAITYNSSLRTFMLKQELVSANLSLREANEKLARLAVIDPLTQVSNRRAFDQYMALAWRKSFKDATSVSAIMIDVDDFKKYNDSYGHQMGDDCLKSVASCIASVFRRDSDMVARYGGEEFIVLTVQDDNERLQTMAEKARLAVEALHRENTGGLTGYITISVGIATVVPTKELRYEDLVKMADDALYRSKHTGKNRVSLAGEQSETATQ